MGTREVSGRRGLRLRARDRDRPRSHEGQGAEILVTLILKGIFPVEVAPEVPAEYWELVQENTHRRITLAGYRIADPIIAAADEIVAQRAFAPVHEKY